MSDLIQTEVPHFCEMTIWQSEDLFEAVPQMISGSTGEPLDLSTFASLQFDLWIKSDLNMDAIEIALLSSRGSAGIVIESAAKGMIALQRDRSIVATWPIGDWVQFLNMTWVEAGFAYTKTLWRGPIHILPGRFT